MYLYSIYGKARIYLFLREESSSSLTHLSTSASTVADRLLNASSARPSSSMSSGSRTRGLTSGRAGIKGMEPGRAGAAAGTGVGTADLLMEHGPASRFHSIYWAYEGFRTIPESSYIFNLHNTFLNGISLNFC